MNRTGTGLAERAADAAPVGLVLTDRDGVILYVNASGESLLGRSRKRLTGLGIESAGPLGQAAGDMVRRAMAEGRAVVAHDVLAPVEGGEMRFSIDASPEGGGACVSLRPWPESAASPRGDAAASAAAGFGRMLSHELKNPIAGARGAAQLIAQDAQGESAELARVIMTELDRARRIAERWSRVGDIAPQPFAPVNLNALVQDAARSAAAGAPETIVWTEHFDPSIPDALADRDLALQAVLNLLVNAAEALGEAGGQIGIYTRYRRARPGAPAPSARLEVAVSDDGPGVPDHLQEAAFSPFVTGKPAGEGLGLAMAARIADIHGGGVEFESRPGRTVFHLYFREAGREAGDNRS